MLEQIIAAGSLTKLTAAEKRRFRIKCGLGTLLFGLAVLLQTARDYGRLLLGVHTKSIALALELLGIALMFWAAAAGNHSSASPEEKSTAVTTRH